MEFAVKTFKQMVPKFSILKAYNRKVPFFTLLFIILNERRGFHLENSHDDANKRRFFCPVMLHTFRQLVSRRVIMRFSRQWMLKS